MPATPEVDSVVRASSSLPDGAGEPSGEPAPRRGILESVPDDLRRQLPDDVVDELLAGARTEEEIVGPGGLLAAGASRLEPRWVRALTLVSKGLTASVSPPAVGGQAVSDQRLAAPASSAGRRLPSRVGSSWTPGDVLGRNATATRSDQSSEVSSTEARETDRPGFDQRLPLAVGPQPVRDIVSSVVFGRDD